jgi:hypothetical protein
VIITIRQGSKSSLKGRSWAYIEKDEKFGKAPVCFCGQTGRAAVGGFQRQALPRADGAINRLPQLCAML